MFVRLSSSNNSAETARPIYMKLGIVDVQKIVSGNFDIGYFGLF
jgi:hypothetical protein